MEALLEVLKYVLPSLVVFATVYLVIKSFLDEQLKRQELEVENQLRKKELDIKAIQKQELSPLRLQAYERIVLFLERISPHSLLPRLQKPEMNVTSLQNHLLNAIRSEFEHNLSQQIYISKEAWMITKNAKENIIKIINTAKDGLPPEAAAFELSKRILEQMIHIKTSPTDAAIDFLKKEIDGYF